MICLSYIIPYVYEDDVHIHTLYLPGSSTSGPEARCRRHRGDAKPKGLGSNPSGSREKPSAFGWKYVGMKIADIFPWIKSEKGSFDGQSALSMNIEYIYIYMNILLDHGGLQELSTQPVISFVGSSWRCGENLRCWILRSSGAAKRRELRTGTWTRQASVSLHVLISLDLSRLAPSWHWPGQLWT